MRTRKYLGWFLSVGLMSSCGQNPEVHLVPKEKQPEPDLQLTKPDRGPPAFSFDGSFPDVMEFEQGVAHQYDFFKSAHVPSPGVPILSVEQRPDGASFESGVLRWTPGCDMEPAFFVRGYGVAYMLVTLKSSLDANQFVQRRAAMIIHKFKEFPDRKCGQND